MNPRLLAAKRKVGSVLVSAKAGNKSDGFIIDPRLVSTWENTFYNLWYTYLEEFLFDKLLSAVLLDPRNGCGRVLSIELLTEAKGSLVSHLEMKYDQIQEKRTEERSKDGDDIPQNAGVSVSSGRSEALGTHLLPKNAVARALEVDCSEDESNSNHKKIVKNQLIQLFNAVTSSNYVGHWKSDPMNFYK